MALTKIVSLADNFGEMIPFLNAYIKITKFAGTKSRCVCTYGIFRSSEGELLVEQSNEFSLDLNGPNPIKQAYQFLKTLPEFADATDC